MLKIIWQVLVRFEKTYVLLLTMYYVLFYY